MRKNILITGQPHSGKSTILKHIIAEIDHKVGFIAEEIRDNDQRVGFFVENHKREKGILAHVDFKTDIQVSKYFVDIKNLDAIIPSVWNFNDDDVVYLDEIGQMELYSEKFKALAQRYLDSKNICIATVSAIFQSDFIDNIKNRSDIILIEITPENREEKKEFIEQLLKKIQKARTYLTEPERIQIISENQASVVGEHATRNLHVNNEKWLCDCNFFQKNNICSHVITIEEFYKNRHGN